MCQDDIIDGGHYTGVTQLRDICYLCFGRKVHGDENKFVTHMADQNKNAPGPSTAAAHLSRIQALAEQMKDTQPEQARCFAPLTRLIQETDKARGTDWCSWVGPPELGVVML